jgi:hypothetical protein
VQLDDKLGPVLTEVGLVSVRDSFGGDLENTFGYGAYAAPEVRDSVSVDARSDIFSAGRLLCFLALEGTPTPESGDALAKAAPPGLVEIVKRCTAESPADRYATAGALLTALDSILGQMEEADRGAAGRAPPPAAPPPVKQAQGPAFGEAFGAAAARREEAPRTSFRKVVALVGLLMLAGAASAAYGLGFSTERGHDVLCGLLALGGALATLAVPPPSRSPLAFRFALTAGVATLLLMMDPLHPLFQAGAYHRLRGGEGSRRPAIMELVLLGRDFRGAKLSGVDLSSLDLRGADMRGADLRQADFTGSNMWGALFEDASVDGALLSGTDLSESTLAHANNLTGAACDAHTTLPLGWLCAQGHPAEER